MTTIMKPGAERDSAPHRERSATRLLVATDASPSAESALRAARAIARHCDAEVSLLAVHQAMPIAAPEIAIPASPGMDAEARAGLRFHVQAQLDRMGIEEDWPLDVVTGDPAASIARIAGETGATLIVLGIGHHGFFDRLFGDETVLKLLRLTQVPVLAVAPGFDGLPDDVLVATDFSASSVRAADLACRLMNGSGRLTLAHVMDARDAGATAVLGAPTGFEGSVGRAFDLVISRLPEPRPDVSRRVLTGAPGQAIIEAAQTCDADLIVAGSHGHGFLTRLVLGSVSQKLVRHAGCSVLIAPPEGGSYLDEVPELTTRFASDEWAERLEEFTRRNLGRMATLEVIDPDIGAQIEQKGFPFVGAVFEPRNGHVQIMLGDGSRDGRHLTRAIGHVTAVQVLRDRAGRDLLLRVAHGRGQTLLTLER